VDTTKFIKSDARYSIQVKVTNQKLVADDVTEFTPIPNVPASKFNEIYGDCFISGFIEGGVLSALVLKKLVDESDLKKIGGGISIKLDLKAVNVEGKAEGDKTDESKKKNEETTIRCVNEASSHVSVKRLIAEVKYLVARWWGHQTRYD